MKLDKTRLSLDMAGHSEDHSRMMTRSLSWIIDHFCWAQRLGQVWYDFECPAEDTAGSWHGCHHCNVTSRVSQSHIRAHNTWHVTTYDVRSLPPSLMSHSQAPALSVVSSVTETWPRLKQAVCLRRRTITQERYLTPAPAKWTQSGPCPGPRNTRCGAAPCPRLLRVSCESLVIAGPGWGRPGHSWLRLWVSQLTQIPDTDPGPGPDTRNTRSPGPGSPSVASLLRGLSRLGPLCANLVRFYVRASCCQEKRKRRKCLLLF